MSKWKMVPVEPTDQMIRAIDGLICSSYLWPVYAYRAMIDAAPVPTAADCTSVCDAYAAENQQFSDELARLRALLREVRIHAPTDLLRKIEEEMAQWR